MAMMASLLRTIVVTLSIISAIVIECNHIATADSVTGVSVQGVGSRSWGRVVEQAMNAYQLGSANAVVDFTVLGNTAARSQLAQNIVDYAISDTPHTPDEALQTPDLVSLPFAGQALVFVFNLAGVGSGKLTLTPTVIAQIVMGNITKWNDAQLTALNPSLKMPNSNISLIVRTDGNVINPVLYRGLYAAYTPFAQTVKASADAKSIAWPYTANLLRVASFFSLGTIMATIPNTLGFMWLDECTQLGLPYANLKNTLGEVIAPDADSVLFAVMERGGVPLDTTTGALADLTGVTGPAAWPFTAYSYLVLRTTGFRQACAIKTACIKFWQWFFTSTTSYDVASSLGFVIPPDQIRESHGIDELLSTGIFCRGELSSPSERTEQSLGIGTDVASNLFTLYPIVYNNLDTANGTIAYETSGSDDALQSLIFGEVDFAITVGELTRSDWLSEALDDGSVYQLPMFLSRFTMVYNLPTLSASNNMLLVDFNLLSDIWSGEVRSWDDPRIAALNPDLAAAGKLPSVNISRVVVTSGEREADRTFFQALSYWTAQDTSPFNLTVDSSGVVNPYWSLQWLDKKDTLITQVGSDDKVQAAVTNTIGAIGITVVDGDLEATTQRIRLRKNNGDIVTESSLAAYRCTIDTWNITDLSFSIYESKMSGCWPFSTAVYSVVRTENDASQCLNAKRALQFLSYIHDQTSVNAELAAYLAPNTFTNAADDATLAGVAASSSAGALVRTSAVAEGLGVLWMPPYVRASVQRKLQAATCEGETILVTLPVDHRITQPIESAALAITILGACAVALILCFIYFFHLRSAIKASSPLFLLATLSGILLMFVAGTLLTHEFPSSVLCGSGWWLANLGFTLTFGPLFVKCWRIYKIFMRKEMTVVRLTDANLFARLGMALAAEILFLAGMQASDPFTYQSVVQSALPRDQTIFYCAPNDITLAAVLGGYKGLILLFGALMSFSTRSVSENFNESKPIAFSIYNVLFTCVIVIPIALLNQSDGRTLYLLAVFTLYWITLCTFCITFGPKVITIYKDASGFIAQRVSDSKASASELSRTVGARTIKELSQQPIRLMDRPTLRLYASLLEKELSAARAALATLDANEGILAGVAHQQTAAQHASQLRTVSGLGNTTLPGQVTNSPMLTAPRNLTSTPPGSTQRLLLGVNAANANASTNNQNSSSPRSRAASVYKYPPSIPSQPAVGSLVQPNNGSSTARAPSPNTPLVQRVNSVAPAPLLVPTVSQSPMSPSLQSSAAEYKTPTPLPAGLLATMISPSHAAGGNGLSGPVEGSETRFRMPAPPGGSSLTARSSAPLQVTVSHGEPPLTHSGSMNNNAWRTPAVNTDRMSLLRNDDRNIASTPVGSNSGSSQSGGHISNHTSDTPASPNNASVPQ